MSLCVGCVTFTTTKVGKLRPVSWHSPKSKQTNEISHAPFKFLKKIPSSSKSIFAAYDTLNILHSFLWNFSCVLTVLSCYNVWIYYMYVIAICMNSICTTFLRNALLIQIEGLLYTKRGITFKLFKRLTQSEISHAKK